MNVFYRYKIYNIDWKNIKSIYYSRRWVTEFRIGWFFFSMDAAEIPNVTFLFVYFIANGSPMLNSKSIYVVRGMSYMAKNTFTVEFREIMRKLRDSINIVCQRPEAYCVIIVFTVVLVRSNPNTFTPWRCRSAGDFEEVYRYTRLSVKINLSTT